MVACDGDCSNWFHPSCVALEAIPDGQWVCPGCRVRAEPDPAPSNGPAQHIGGDNQVQSIHIHEINCISGCLHRFTDRQVDFKQPDVSPENYYSACFNLKIIAFEKFVAFILCTYHCSISNYNATLFGLNLSRLCPFL